MTNKDKNPLKVKKPLAVAAKQKKGGPHAKDKDHTKKPEPSERESLKEYCMRLEMNIIQNGDVICGIARKSFISSPTYVLLALISEHEDLWGQSHLAILPESMLGRGKAGDVKEAERCKVRGNEYGDI